MKRCSGDKIVFEVVATPSSPGMPVVSGCDEAAQPPCRHLFCSGMKGIILALLVWAGFSLGPLAHAASIEVGDAVPPVSARDQHGTNYLFTNGTAWLLVALDMESARAANKKLAAAGAGFLEKQGAIYLMDIHAMPAIARFFALPKMRKYPQRIVLVETAGALNWVPAKAGHVTLLKLTLAGRVEKIGYWRPAAESVTDLFK